MTTTQITFRGMPEDRSVEAAIERWVERLEYVDADLRRCRVIVESEHRGPTPFRVRVVLEPSTGDVVIARDLPLRADVYVAVSDAFRVARRLLLSQLPAETPTPRTAFAMCVSART